MKKSIFFFLSGLIIGALFVHFLLPSSNENWEPALEETSFVYFDTPIENIIHLVNDASNHILSKNNAGATDNLQQAENQLGYLKVYYLPLTEIRQLIYDADRLFYFKDKKHSIEKLKTAQQMIKQISETGGSGLTKVGEEVFLKIDDLILNYNQSTSIVTGKFKELFHRVNMMLLKGGLILSDVTLSEGITN